MILHDKETGDDDDDGDDDNDDDDDADDEAGDADAKAGDADGDDVHFSSRLRGCRSIPRPT